MRNYFRPPKERLRCDNDCITCRSSASASNLCHEKFVIYKVKCNICNQIYIGETERMVKSRIREHLNLNNESSHVVLHARKNHNGNMDIQWSLLHTGLNHKAKRKKLEALYIKRLSNDFELMNGCRGASLTIS